MRPQTVAGGNGTADAGSSSSAYFRVNGVDEWQNDFRLNGINDNIEIYGGNYTGTNAAIVPPPDAIEEFTLQSGDFSAEFGHSTGGIINASLKSGTNSVHGDLWEYVRNNDLNANYFFNRTCCRAALHGQAHSLLSPEPLRLHGRGTGGDPARHRWQEPALLVCRLPGWPLRTAGAGRQFNRAQQGHGQQRISPTCRTTSPTTPRTPAAPPSPPAATPTPWAAPSRTAPSWIQLQPASFPRPASTR